MADKDEDCCAHAIVVVLCGLPGAGKTTLARQLQAWLEQDEEGTQGQGGGVVRVCMRDRVGVTRPTHLGSNQSIQAVHYVGFDAIEASLLRSSTNNDGAGASWSLEAWHAARHAALQQAEEHLRRATAGQRVAVVLDDNMYYRR
jgi:GTPase SAR1 family protein